ncbi:MAG: type II toxin-antitoxin system BrnA family antitoxin [Cyanobacteriota bacterium]|jgi:hypothetical protein
MKAEEFDRKFDEGESILEYLDLSQIQRFDQDEPTITLAFSAQVMAALSQESQRRNLPIATMLQGWVEERLSAAP